MYVFNDVKLNIKRTVRSSLISIFGINNFRANLICSLAGLAKNFRMNQLSEFYFNILAFLLKKSFWTELDLKEQRIRNIRWLIDNQSYRGLRYEQHLPAHANVRRLMQRLVRKNNRDV